MIRLRRMILASRRLTLFPSAANDCVDHPFRQLFLSGVVVDALADAISDGLSRPAQLVRTKPKAHASTQWTISTPLTEKIAALRKAPDEHHRPIAKTISCPIAELLENLRLVGVIRSAQRPVFQPIAKMP